MHSLVKMNSMKSLATAIKQMETLGWSNMYVENETLRGASARDLNLTGFCKNGSL